LRQYVDNIIVDQDNNSESLDYSNRNNFIELIWNNSYYEVKWNGIIDFSLSCSNTTPISVNYPYWYTWQGKFKLDDIRIRKYANPEPPTNLGEEKVIDYPILGDALSSSVFSNNITKATLWANDTNYTTKSFSDTFNYYSKLSEYENIAIEDGDLKLNTNWWNTSFKKCQNITISSPVNDYQYKLILNTTNFNYSYANDDGSDIRIVNASCCNGGVEVPYWIEKWNKTGDSTLWFRGDNSSTTTYALYYNYTDAENKSNGTKTFLYFTDFDIDKSSDFQTVGSATFTWETSNSRLKGVYTANTWQMYQLKTTYSRPIAIGARLQQNYIDWHCDGGIGYGKDTTTNINNYQEIEGYHFNLRSSPTLRFSKTSGTEDYHPPSGSFSTNTWYIVGLEVNDTNVTGFIYDNNDNKLEVSHLDTTFDNLHPGISADIDGGIVYWDWFYIRNYTYPEPTTTLGPQENINDYLEYSSEGQAKSTQITPNSYFLKWKTFQVSDDTTPDGTDISYKILKASDDTTLCSISSPQAESGYDISSCAGTNPIKLYANLSTTNASNTPLLHEWNVSWLEQIGNITYELSADGGSHWELVSKGQEHTFTYPGNSLILRINLTTFDTAYTPSVENYTINYTYTLGVLTNNLNYTLSSNSNANESENWVCTQDLDNNIFVAWVFNGTKPEDTSYSQSGNNYGISITSPENILLAFSKGDCSKVKGRESAIKSGSFWNSIFPAFSYETLNYVVDLILQYTNINIVNDLRIGEGSYNLIIKNNGTSSGKVNLVIEKI